jgi:hypothetical protein
MTTLSPLLRFTGIACCIGAIVFSMNGLRAQDQPERVTSDTPEYCMHLLDEVSALVRVAPASPPEEVTSLSTEGQKMCVHGQTKGGILRLRRALVLMRDLETSP